jgi:chromosome partitioning protein
MNIIAIANQKGGCAKTTTVVNLAHGFAELGIKTLVIDLDPQANATQWLGVSSENFGSFEMLVDGGNIDEVILPSRVNEISLIAASKKLTQVEKALVGQIAIESILKRRIEKSALLKTWDVVLLDTPPTLGLLTLNALVAANELLVPVTAHVMSLMGVTQLINTLNDVRDLLNPELKILGYLASRVDLRTKHSKDVMQLLKEKFGDKVFKTFIRENISLAEAPSFSLGIMEYRSSSAASEDYRALAKEVSNLLKLKAK